MTHQEIQTRTFAAAVASADNAMEMLRIIDLDAPSRIVIYHVLFMIQLATVREVAQYDANQRAAVASITEEQITAFINGLR